MATVETPKLTALRGMFPRVSVAAWEQVKEYGPTFLTEFAVMASQIATYKLAAHLLGKQGFSEYALARRTVSLIFPIPVLGLGVGLPRYIGFSNGRNDPSSARRYYGATLWCAGIAALICVALLNLFSSAFGYLFFADRNYGYLAFPLGLMIFGLCMHTVVCGYFRGHMELGRANVLQAINLAFVPLVVFLIVHQSLVPVFTWLGSIWTLVSGAALFLTPVRAIREDTRKEMSELLRYGIQRVPGDFILMALFTVPATVVAHVSGVQDAGFVAFGISVVSMIGAVFAPLGLVLLPKATSMLAGGATKDLRRHLGLMVRLTLASAAALVVLGWLCLPALIRFCLGTNFDQVVPIVRVLILAALPYCLYLVVRNVVDAYHDYGVTAAILAVGLAVFFIGLLIGKQFGGETRAILIDFLVAQIVIAILSTLECRRILS
jgi:O-antigen/teichoic acid export membrane protein